jgi:hypothetical protein
MPEYLYENPKRTSQVVAVIQTMKEKHEYFGPDGEPWRRVFTVPQGSIDTQWDHNSAKDFAEKTRNKKGTLGDLWDKSAELGEKRAKERGKDPLQEKAFNDYKKATGKEHPHKPKPALEHWE